MIAPNHGKHGTCSGIIKTPGYPFTAQELYRVLRSRLEAESGEELTFKRLGQLIGKSKSTAHHWFSLSTQPQVIAWLCLLERLSAPARHLFVEKHCRVFPTLEHPSLGYAQSKIVKLLELLRQSKTLTLVCGTDSMRTFVVTAMGHAYRAAAGSASGIDVHRPSEFVPVESLVYLDPAVAPIELKGLILKAWPKIQTSTGKLIILNGVWSRIAEIREEILRCATRNHVLVAEAGTPDLAFVRARVSTPVHLVTVRAAKRIPNGINLNCRRLKPLK